MPFFLGPQLRTFVDADGRLVRNNTWNYVVFNDAQLHAYEYEL
jgi:hypothetical protein